MIESRSNRGDLTAVSSYDKGRQSTADIAHETLTKGSDVKLELDVPRLKPSITATLVEW